MNVLLNYHGLQSGDVYDGYRSIVAREFYDGELGLGADPLIHTLMEKAVDHPLILTRLKSHNQISYRRRPSHIRSNKTDFQTVWIIRRGGLRVIRTDGTVITTAGCGAIYDSSSPFFVELMMDEEGLHESLIGFIPMHLFRSKVGDMSNFNLSFPLTSGPGMIAERVLTLMYDHGNAVNRATRESLANCALGAIANCLSEQVGTALSVLDQRIAEIRKHISRDLSDPNLSAARIAEGCSISIRYLHYILKGGGDTLSTLLWNARLDKAREGLLATSAPRLSVNDIAQMCGYKSVSHFRRQFRARYGVSPKQYRDRQTQ